MNHCDFCPWVIFSRAPEGQGISRRLEEGRFCSSLPKGDRPLELPARQLTFSALNAIAIHCPVSFTNGWIIV